MVRPKQKSVWSSAAGALAGLKQGQLYARRGFNLFQDENTALHQVTVIFIEFENWTCQIVS